MELRQLRYLVAAVEFGSFGKAASELGIVTSALSQQISKLEGELAVRLLVRGAGGVAPTEAGAAFCQHAALALRHADAAVVAAQGARLSGVVSLGLAPTTATVLAIPLIEAMGQRYPHIRLQIVEGMSGHLAGMLKSRQIDLAILFNAETVAFARGEALPILDESLFLVGDAKAGHTLPEGSTITLSEAALLPLILPSRGHGLRLSLDRAFASAKAKPTVVMEIDSLSVIMDAVLRGHGYTIQPGAALARTPAGLCSVRAIDDKSVYRSNLLASLPEQELSPSALALRAQIRKTVSSLVKGGLWLGATIHDP